MKKHVKNPVKILFNRLYFISLCNKITKGAAPIMRYRTNETSTETSRNSGNAETIYCA